MGDGGDEPEIREGAWSLRGLFERIDLHMTDLDVVSDEILKVQELISETINSGEQRLTEGNLGEARDRLEKRVRKWIQQINDEYRVMRAEMLRQVNGRDETHSAPSFPATESHSVVLLDGRTSGRSGLKKLSGGRSEKGLLTRREGEVLKLVAEGKTSKSIAERLSISVHTVDRHRANIMAKLDMRKVADLVKYAISQGLIPFDGGGRGDH
jgi:DNA-binding CsgD family transcriptional regulator